MHKYRSALVKTHASTVQIRNIPLGIISLSYTYLFENLQIVLNLNLKLRVNHQINVSVNARFLTICFYSVYSAETQVIRKVAPAYSDGVFEPSGTSRPNPLVISDAVMNGTSGLASRRNRTALLVFYGKPNSTKII